MVRWEEPRCQFLKSTAANCQSGLQRTGYAVISAVEADFIAVDVRRTAVDYDKMWVSAAHFDQDCRGLWQDESLYFNGNR